MAEVGQGEAFVGVLIAVVVAFWTLHAWMAVILATLSTAYFLIREHDINAFWKKQGIAGPTPLFFLGNALQLRSGFQSFDIENVARFGKVFGTSLLGRPDLIIADPKLLHSILIEHFSSFIDRRDQFCVRSDVNIINHMLTVMEGQRWRYMRRRISYKFSTKSLRAFFPTFVKCTEECITKCSEKARQGGDFDAQRVCGELALDIIKQFVFGVSVHSQSALESELMYYCRKVLNFSSTKGRLILDALFPTLLSSTENLIGRTIFDNDSNQFFIDFVKENLMRNCIDESCLLQFLKDEINSTAGEHELPTKRGLFEMNERSIAGICFNFLIAGYETSLNTMQFALFSLAHHKDIQDKAFQEISQVMGDKEKVLYDDVNKLTYLEQIFMETLRLFPPASRFDRKCRESITLSNVRFNRNCIASVPLFAIHYDEDVYPKANQFDPDRFSPEAVTSRNPYSFMPFGIGPRSCIGKRFAILQFKLTMACLLRNFVFEKCDNTPPEPLELDTRGMTRPKRPIILKITDRQFSPKKCSK